MFIGGKIIFDYDTLYEDSITGRWKRTFEMAVENRIHDMLLTTGKYIHIFDRTFGQ